MGTDIHGRIQARWDKERPWHDEGEIERSRNYLVFAILAGVRNGFGFAGVPTHEPIVPIAEPRGIPDDAPDSTKVWIDGNLQCDVQCDYGEHSQSWLMLDEILAWDGWDKDLQRTGVLDREEYERVQREGGQPNNWCGGVSGLNVSVTQDPLKAPADWTHVQMAWNAGPVRENCSPYWEWFQYLKAKHGAENCRIVFGFDS